MEARHDSKLRDCCQLFSSIALRVTRVNSSNCLSKFHVEMTASLVVDVVIVQSRRIQEKSSLSLMTIKDF